MSYVADRFIIIVAVVEMKQLIYQLSEDKGRHFIIEIIKRFL